MTDVNTEFETADETAVEEPVVDNSLISRLNRWANANGLERSPFIAMVSAAIRDQRNLNFWSTVDMVIALPEPRYSGGDRRNRFQSFLTVVRNVMVFVPVALTWAAISVATAAFGVFSQQNQATPVNFLQFWQDGYGYLADFWRINQVARLDVAVILFVILLTLVIGYLETENNRDFQIGQTKADEDRLAFAMELQNYFHLNREITVENVSDAVLNSISTLQGMAREMTNSMSELGVVMQVFSNLVPDVNQLSRDVSELNESTASKIADLTTGLSAGVENANSVLKDMTQTVNTLGQDARLSMVHLTEVNDSVTTVGTNFKVAVDTLQESIGQVKSKLDVGLSEAIETGYVSIDRIINEMDVTSTSLKSSSRAVQDELEALHRSLKRARELGN
jgi:methyl-accepting chemotaxis protein